MGAVTGECEEAQCGMPGVAHNMGSLNQKDAATASAATSGRWPGRSQFDVPFAASARGSFICGMAASAPPATTRLPERLERIPRDLAGLRRNQMVLVRDKTLEVHQLISHPFSTVPPMPLMFILIRFFFFLVFLCFALLTTLIIGGQ